ncbi:hypothetical protein [Microlunatus soli]|uniref:Uncharacterized protein n=1 Tax=Microlunatus soli TaxID=630515 RepID=A0A1H1R8T4_9ACTN|nr:hypothetical protein [Microlunatus soli]SDS32065.1 hypothetical protein SAMN04489812_1553 [Microlunatus soli]
MIPTMILFGAVLGRWWRLTLVAGTIGWPVLLLLADIPMSPQGLAEAAALGLANTLAGVLVHQAVLKLVRIVRSRRHAIVQPQ